MRDHCVWAESVKDRFLYQCLTLVCDNNSRQLVSFMTCPHAALTVWVKIIERPFSHCAAGEMRQWMTTLCDCIIWRRTMCKFKQTSSSWIFPLLLLLATTTQAGKKSNVEINLDEFLEGLRVVENEDSNPSNETDWRPGLSVVAKNEYLLSNSLLTDCTVLVGPDREPIQAHRLFLSRSSAILAAYLNNSTQTVYLDDVSVTHFKALLKYIYRGSFCAASVEEACSLLRHAKRYQMAALEEKIRTYLWVNMYPDKVWYTFRCAAENNDQFLIQAALNVISWRTEELIEDPLFLNLPHSALTQVLQLKTLNLTNQYVVPPSSSSPQPEILVSAEMKLFDGVLHWAVAEAERLGLDPSNPESIRGVLGVVFKNLLAVMLNFEDFNSGSTSHDPTYNEALDVLYNTNSVYQPSVLHSPLLKSRKPESLEVRGSRDYLSCNRNQNRNIYDILTSSLVPRGNVGRRLVGIQMPARQINFGDLCVVNEDLTVEVLDENGVLLTEQRTTLASMNVCTKLAPKHIDVQFSNPVAVQNSGARVRVVFHSTPGKYPSTCAGFATSSPAFFEENLHELIKQSDAFICSFVFAK